MFKNKIDAACFLMFFFNIFGSILLFFDPFKEIVLTLTPVNLLTMLVLFFWGNANLSINLFKTISLIYVIGVLVEIIGVNSSVVFGEYYYGQALGLQIFGTPLIIGVNWLTLSLATFGISSYIFRHGWLIVLFASTLMVATDFIIEPLAGVLDFWYWSSGKIPLQNYIAWFFVSLIIQFILVKGKIKLNTKLCFSLLFSQVVFFLIQYINNGII
jgi:putative membrane protein